MYFPILSMTMTNKARWLFSGLNWSSNENWLRNKILPQEASLSQFKLFHICEMLCMFRNWIQNVGAFSIACANYCRRRYTNCIQFMQNNNSSDVKEKKEYEDKEMKTKVSEGLIRCCLLCFNLFLIHFVPIHLLFIKVSILVIYFQLQGYLMVVQIFATL